MNKKNTKQSKVDAMLSDSDDEPVVNKKITTKKTASPKKRKQSAASESSASVNLLKNKRKASKEEKKPKKQVDSDSDDEPKKPIQKAKVVSKKNADSDSEDEKPKKQVKKVSVEKKKADSDSEDEKPKKQVKKVSVEKKKADSDSEDEKPKKQVQKKKADSDSEDEKPKKQVQKKKADSDSDGEVDVPMKNLTKSSAKQEDDGETHAELFVKNLSYNSTEDSIYEHFAQYGTVLNVKLLTDKMTGRPKGIGFVGFASRAEAKNALEKCGEVDGRQPTCSWSNDKSGIQNNNQGGFNNNQGGYNKGGFGNSRPQQSSFGGVAHTIFVGNLGFRTNEDSVRKFFSKVGNVVGVRIAKQEDGKAKGFCHVDFDAQEAAQAALALAGQNLDGREIRVDMSEPRKGGAGGQGGRGRPEFNNRGPARPQVGRLGEGQGKKVTFDDDE